MSGSVFKSGHTRSIFARLAAAQGRPLPAVRKVAWFGHIKPEVAAGLADTGWEVVEIQPERAGVDAAAAVGADVAVADFDDGNARHLAWIEALIGAHPERQWLAVASEEALTSTRVCELIHDACFDFFVRPLRVATVASSLGQAWGKTRLLPPERLTAAQPDSDLGLVGASAAMAEVRTRLRRFARFDMPVLLTGETGTGKDVAARAIHAQSDRREGPLVAINCGALPENLVQSELFGHERGAFTGATARKIGRIEAAQGGVVFLDEIGDLPLDAQCNLLRFLEAHTIERVGGTQTIKVDARVVAATHVDLQRAVAEGRFREDLFYRLNVLHVHLPAVRERDGDAVLLATHFLDAFLRAHAMRPRRFSAAARKAIAAYAWPGNVRELLNRIQRSAVTSGRAVLGPAELALPGTAPAAPDLSAARAQTDRETIAEHLRASGFNMSECARRLKISRMTLYRLCRKHQLKIDSALLPLVLVGAAPDADAPVWPVLAAACDWVGTVVGPLLA